ncbi:ABC transporter permease subunit [Engelhardtia mirabilis]|uniref:ABC-2 family transporter protein n=1 Tax=Engelhardtia mirabilis TaxID=2528011 RepID=A0A518BKV9_9BACT|nr:ABC-2 family transporter protein [Planctomycetes bacterium Pla133]QDV01934.1 ABC-2 family transporter protein [Planctomycetes bacterium Pla86]
MPPLLRAALRIAAKDLRSCLRDRQTIIYAVVLPLAMYPVMFWIMLQAQILIEGKRSAQTLSIAVLVEQSAAERAAELTSDLGLDTDATSFEAWAPLEVLGTSEPDLAAAARERARTLLELDSPPDVILAVYSPAGEQPTLAILYDGARARSTNARERLEQKLAELAEVARDDALESVGTDRNELAGLEFRPVNLATGKEVGAFIASMLLPMMIVVMAVMGAFYPAVDLTAGERERGTEETTLLLPVPRTAVQLGKLLAVTAIGGLASSMNLLGMGVAAGHLLGMTGAGGLDFQLDPLALLLVAPLVLIFVLFTSAILTAIASFAETFKQGQSLLGSAQLLFIFPAMASSLPGLTLTPGIAAIPVVGAAVGFRTILRGGPLGELPWGGLALCALAMVAYATLAVLVSVRLLNQELRTGGSTSVVARLRAAVGLTGGGSRQIQ